ncbi:hypothetical protein B0T11DRAFT_122578 [Plectosphaerella cucumerina]|uniref:MARVEL domain-containing protein n=1 Tax=Plectosphaerella cucumerina TaxID=40658 RepID=A0A8K0TER8_9PEZI|nr:hypothetical protein B0T11DRAFT_122578 [Plectosphaerella cucumerina]
MALPLPLVSIAHIVAAVFCFITVCLTGYIASRHLHAPDVIGFTIFNSVWSLLVLAYIALTPIFMAKLFHQLVSLGLLAVTVIFWFAGSIALADALGAPRCQSAYCGAWQAAIAFSFFIWAIFTGLLVLDIMAVLRSRGHSNAHSKPGHGNAAGTNTYPGV